jgi:hypothetical protein
VRRRIIIPGLLGVMVFGGALIAVAIGDGGPSPEQPPGVALISHNPAATLSQLGVTGALASGTASAPGKIAVATADGDTVRALSCNGTSKITAVAGPDGAASVATSVGSAPNGIPCADVGRDLAIASGAPQSVVLQFSHP